MDNFLDEPIKTFIPDLKDVQETSEPPYGLTIKQLLNHTSGFKEFDSDTKKWLGSERTQYSKKLHPSDIKNYFENNKGTYKLSQHGYNLLGWICAPTDREHHG